MLTLGPAFWIRRLSPAKWASFLGYLTGWTTNAFWWFLCTANYLYMAQLTAGLAQAYHPTYNPRQWHIYLIYIAYSLGPFVLNLPHFFKIVPYSMSAGVFVINATSIFILVSLLVRATPKPTAHQVFVEVVNDSGWSSNGVVFFIALLPGTLTVNAFDSVTHITDEVENPSKQIPLVMMGGATFTAIAAFLMTIVYSFSVVNSANLLAPFSGQPLLQLVYDATRSEVITVISILGVLVSFFIASTGCFASWNRLYWSVSVNDDLPFSRLTSRLSSRDNLPVNAMIANLILVIAIGAIQIGSLTALNAVIGGAIICITGTYALTFALALYRGRDILAKDRWLDMGRFGTALQIVGMLWSAFISVWLSFPLYLPVTLDYMNWASVVFVGTMACAVIFYIVSRKALRK